MQKVLRGYAKDKNGVLILLGTMPVPLARANPLQGNAKIKDIW